jgi:hypothetical protein
MNFQISRAGRKRKQGIRRHPCGQPVDERINVAAIAIAHPDRQALPETKRADERAGTFLGRLSIQGLLTDEQLEAARLFERLVRRFQQSVGSPSPTAAAIDLLGSGGGILILDPQEIEFRRVEYDNAYCALNKGSHIARDGATIPGHKALRAVSRVCVYGEGLPDGSTFTHLSTGLTVLVHHFGLTTKRKSVHYINTQ